MARRSRTWSANPSKVIKLGLKATGSESSRSRSRSRACVRLVGASQRVVPRRPCAESVPQRIPVQREQFGRFTAAGDACQNLNMRFHARYCT